jgi:hypothetical protein
MPFPAGASTITVTGTFPVPVAGTARAGQVVFTPSAVLVDSTQHAIYSGGGPVDLDASGHFSVVLLCTDDTDVQPSGWRWRVDEQPTGGQRRTYWIALPSTLGATVDLSTLAPVSAPDGSGQVSASGPSPASTVVTETAYGQSSSAGSASAYARGDHTHGSPALSSNAASTSAVGDTAAAGTGATPARADHVHGREAFGTVTAQTSFGAASANGTAATPARSDHTHGTPSLTGVVLTSGDQVINGEKTFNTNIPVLPAFDAAFANQAIRKAQLDAAIASVSGGSSIRTARVRITDDNLSGLPSAPSWTIAQTSAGTKLQCSIAATAGDRIKVYGNFMRAGSRFLDWVLLDSAGAIALYAVSGTSSPGAEGNPTMYPSLSFSYVTAAEMFTVGSGHLSGGMATVALADIGTSAATVYAHTVYPWRLRLENIGPEPS